MKTKILLCGTNYGASYLAAIAGEDSAFELAGIYARGSERSTNLAKQRGVPFWSRVDEISEDVRAAVLALPPPASQNVAKELIARGVHLLVEHPIWAEQLSELRDSAVSKNVVVHVNCHFAELTAARTFIAECRRRAEAAKPDYVSLVVAPRSAYATFDLIGRALGGVEESFVEREDPVKSDYPFACFGGKIGKTVIRLQCSKAMSKVDDGSDSPVPQRIEVGFHDGNLVLGSPVGPVIWSEKLRLGLRDHPGPLYTDLTERAFTFTELVKDRMAANGRTLAELHAQMNGGPEPMHQSGGWLATVANLAQKVRTQAGLSA